MKILTKFIFLTICFSLLLGACTSQTQSATSTEAALQDIATATTQTKSIYYLWVAPYLPQDLQDQIALPENTVLVNTQDEADIWLDIGGDQQVSQWIYALAAPFPTVTDAITSQELKQIWNGQVSADSPLQKILVDGKTKAIFEKVWGDPSNSTVILTSEENLLSAAWSDTGVWAIIPFETLETRWKVIAVDAISPIDDDFNADQYALSVSFSLLGKPEDLQELNAGITATGGTLVPVTNRDENKITTVVMTGVTALVRGTAYMMEKYGMTYPALDIGDILRNADITHISNEVPFTETCPNPFYNSENDANLVFCSKPEYINLLESVGTDVVELTGDHFRDWGADAMLYTLNMYDERGWKYYGGGHNLAEGQQPALFEHNGNKIAFLGCNAKPEGYATADEDSPGAVHCDMEVMAEQIKAVKEQGYIPIVTFQHIEYYSYAASPYLVKDFHTVAEAGAAIVSGSQAHQPQAFEFYKGAFLHYGLGNLFFDQYNEGAAERQAFIDRYVIYDGRVISTDLITIMFIDMARPRLMLSEERQELLETIFAYSGW
ncbi:MAG: CapA family protein [Anaerolineaceae bacterium]